MSITIQKFEQQLLTSVQIFALENCKNLLALAKKKNLNLNKFVENDNSTMELWIWESNKKIKIFQIKT